MGVFIDPADLPESADGFIQILFLLAVYGYSKFNTENTTEQPQSRPIIPEQPRCTCEPS
jgi:hypothetical protein